MKIMFLCTGNSCRSQMAEGFAQELGKGFVEAYSAGLNPAGVNERAVKVMKEIGIDISQQKSKPIDETLLNKMDMIITLCDNASKPVHGHHQKSNVFTGPFQIRQKLSEQKRK